VAAGEDQLQALVGKCRGVIHRVLRGRRNVEQPRLRRQRLLAADAVDRPVARRRDQPCALVRGLAVTRPALGRQRERLLSGFLGEVEVAEEADQVRENATPVLLEGLLDQRF
jgi:hypothetical protein